ncbi:hypothetical protein LC085_11550 [Bacillus tianshenii]|uniref:hypothetical protein n=1 Tax=Sutcliffiella tianshenii TaxID=1463404 RepID=UPI001CD1B47C|nr:hypothetical protein [Bacillus tianshenii]MCA1320547.1 hypothetical protein [Bacillus tianshenii]
MNVLKKPMTIEEIKQNKDENNYVEGVLPVSLSNIIDNDLEGFLDIISEDLVGSPTLMDVNYSVVGHQDEWTVLIKVSGDASQILDEEEE